MAELTANLFSSWKMAPDEVLEASILTTIQKQHIQNIISGIATEKNNLRFDVQNPASFAQTEAELRGQIDSLIYLLDLSDNATTVLYPPAVPNLQDQP